ncbi:unnamed protein product [Caenorhabditis auriculariae]|uniref:Uncharacterized protein n=1 Tax=Caenorhabditis auriculariae TaxID=2777116 RepID=A0A8S1GVV3_9PELO|nr:unnamed protein product [Caenorhabditis auriculariae]
MARSLLLRGLVRRVLLLRLNWLLSFNNWPKQTRTWLILFSRSLPWLNLLVLFKRHLPLVLLLLPLNLWLFQPQLLKLRPILLKLRPILLWSLLLVSALVLALVFMLALVVSLALWLLLLTVVLLQPLFHILAVLLSCLVVLTLILVTQARILRISNLFFLYVIISPFLALSPFIVMTVNLFLDRSKLTCTLTNYNSVYPPLSSDVPMSSPSCHVNKCFANNCFPNPSGVLQGTVSGPLLFLIFDESDA